jgi:hypothetical protein
LKCWVERRCQINKRSFQNLSYIIPVEQQNTQKSMLFW